MQLALTKPSAETEAASRWSLQAFAKRELALDSVECSLGESRNVRLGREQKSASGPEADVTALAQYRYVKADTGNWRRHPMSRVLDIGRSWDTDKAAACAWCARPDPGIRCEPLEGHGFARPIA